MTCRLGLTLPLLALATLAAAGGSLIPEASPELLERAAQRWPDANLEQLDQGRNIYVKRCSGCHNLHLPAEKSPEQWAVALDEMAVKGKLDENQKAAVLRYLSAASAEQRQLSLAPASGPAGLPAVAPAAAPGSAPATPVPAAENPAANATPAVAQSAAPGPPAASTAAGLEPKK